MSHERDKDLNMPHACIGVFKRMNDLAGCYITVDSLVDVVNGESGFLGSTASYVDDSFLYP